MAAVQYLKQNTTKFDIVFVDPPYGSDLYEAVLAELPRHLNNEGKIYVESDREILPLPGANVVKKSRAGRVHYALWEYLMNKDG
jgi:16S rRNA (guanine966-N2)-methyltransferase